MGIPETPMPLCTAAHRPAVNAPSKEYTVGQVSSAIDSIRPVDPRNQIEQRIKEMLRRALNQIIQEILNWVVDFLGRWLGL